MKPLKALLLSAFMLVGVAAHAQQQLTPQQKAAAQAQLAAMQKQALAIQAQLQVQAQQQAQQRAQAQQQQAQQQQAQADTQAQQRAQAQQQAQATAQAQQAAQQRAQQQAAQQQAQRSQQTQSSPGTYKGIAIRAGSDADIQAQMRAIDANQAQAQQQAQAQAQQRSQAQAQQQALQAAQQRALQQAQSQAALAQQRTQQPIQSSPGSYRGVAIRAGTDADIQAQMRVIDASQVPRQAIRQPSPSSLRPAPTPTYERSVSSTAIPSLPRQSASPIAAIPAPAVARSFKTQTTGTQSPSNMATPGIANLPAVQCATNATCLRQAAAIAPGQIVPATKGVIKGTALGLHDTVQAGAAVTRTVATDLAHPVQTVQSAYEAVNDARGTAAFVASQSARAFNTAKGSLSQTFRSTDAEQIGTTYGRTVEANALTGAAVEGLGVARAFAVPGRAAVVAKDSATVATKAEVLAANQAKGLAAEAATRARLGSRVAGEQVTFVTSKGTRTVADFVTSDSGGFAVTETKSGAAQLSAAQRDLQDDIAAGRPVTPVGQNAANAGLEPGKPVRLKAHDVDRHP